MFRPILFTALLAAGSAAHAGDKPLYAAVPDWVKPAPSIDPATIKDDSPVLLVLDNQERLKDGEVTTYADTVVRIATTQVLESAGTLKLPWQPDKGDLVIHRVEIIRGSEHIDLIAGGQHFSVLHREEQLERLQLDGVLTATLPVEGLRVGDLLRLTVSITQKDPALKGNVQAFASLPAAPLRVEFARTRLIWPEKANIHWKANVSDAAPVVTTAGGYRELTFTVPLAKRPEMPTDAPNRFKRAPIVEATSFDSWEAISKVMAPLYATEGMITPGSPLAEEVARIMAAESDPLKRTALALRLVQDKVRYLFKGMDGGNYVPQSAMQTWTLRYGDCKAKTLLLLTILHAMKIEAEPVLASSKLSDALQDRLPSPGAFDHVFVRAVVAGQTLWLEGTSGGTRLADLQDTPRFHQVLPIRTGGAGLLPIVARPSARPELAADVELDETAGINFPTPFRLALTINGPLAELIHGASSQANKDSLNEMALKLATPYLDNPIVVSRTLSFDDAAGTALMTVTGISYPGWTKENERYRSTLDRVVSQESFDPDRTRVAWRDIPVATDAQHHLAIRTRVHLPDNGKDFTLEGDEKLSATIAGDEIKRTTSFADGWITTSDDAVSSGVEIPVTEIAAARARADQAKQHLLRAIAPAAYPAAWQIVEASKKSHRFDPVMALFKQRIADQPDKAEALTARAWFLERIYERAAAIEDITRAIAIDPSVDSYLWRARLYADMGDKTRALADVTAARKVDPGSNQAITQLASLYADNGEKDQALTLLDTRIDEGGKDKPIFLSAKAEILGEAGDKDGALTTINSAISTTPGNADLLNSRCWIKGTLGVMLDTALKDCTKSIELSESPEKAMDSRAMVYFRLNRFDDALADLNAALDLDPQLPASMFMRGLIRKRMGDAKAGDSDLAAARMMSPQIDRTYAKFGIKP